MAANPTGSVRKNDDERLQLNPKSVNPLTHLKSNKNSQTRSALFRKQWAGFISIAFSFGYTCLIRS